MPVGWRVGVDATRSSGRAGGRGSDRGRCMKRQHNRGFSTMQVTLVHISRKSCDLLSRHQEYRLPPLHAVGKHPSCSQLPKGFPRAPASTSTACLPACHVSTPTRCIQCHLMWPCRHHAAIPRAHATIPLYQCRAHDTADG